MIKQLFLATAIATATGCASIDMFDIIVPVESIAQANTCWDMVDRVNAPNKLWLPELQGEVADIVLDKGWLTAEQIAEVQTKGLYRTVQIGMTPCQVIWTMRQEPNNISSNTSAYGTTRWFRYDDTVSGGIDRLIAFEKNAVTYVGN